MGGLRCQCSLSRIPLLNALILPSPDSEGILVMLRLVQKARRALGDSVHGGPAKHPAVASVRSAGTVLLLLLISLDGWGGICDGPALFTNVELPKPPEEDTPTQAPRRRPRPVDEVRTCSAVTKQRAQRDKGKHPGTLIARCVEVWAA